MNIEKANIKKVIQSLLKEYCDDKEIEIPKIDDETRLIGSNALFDSLGLVGFIVELEEKIEEIYSVEIEIADEKAMSRFKSPFINIGSLSEFLVEKINES